MNGSIAPSSTAWVSPTLTVGAVVGDLRVGVEHVGADAVAESGRGVLALDAGALVRLLVHLPLQEPGAQDLHRALAVLDLGALVLTGDDDARREVGDAYRRRRLVDVLTAGAGGAVGVDAQVVVVDGDLVVVLDLRKDLDQRERGVPPVRGIERGETHQAVRTGLALA